MQIFFGKEFLVFFRCKILEKMESIPGGGWYKNALEYYGKN
jgi:hypothetical protein